LKLFYSASYEIIAKHIRINSNGGAKQGLGAKPPKMSLSPA